MSYLNNSNLEEILDVLKDKIGMSINNVILISKGGWSSNYRIEFKNTHLFLKIGPVQKDIKYGILHAEYYNLKALEASQSLNVPNNLDHISTQNCEAIAMEYISPNNLKTKNYWENAGRQLAHLHLNKSKNFGFDINNFIGSLKQINRPRQSSAYDFFTEFRINPQVKLGMDNGFLTKDDFIKFNRLSVSIRNILPDEEPCLVHGDLWNGNLMVNNQGEPLFIDPSSCYSLREMDLAMTSLFGGFPDEFYKSYHNIYPIPQHYWNHQDLYKLYYLLVHLNIFGRSYYSDVMNSVHAYI